MHTKIKSKYINIWLKTTNLNYSHEYSSYANQFKMIGSGTPYYFETTLLKDKRWQTGWEKMQCGKSNGNPHSISDTSTILALMPYASTFHEVLCIFFTLYDKRGGRVHRLHITFILMQYTKYSPYWPSELTLRLILPSSNSNPQACFCSIQQLSGTLSYLWPPYVVFRQSA